MYYLIVHDSVQSDCSFFHKLCDGLMDSYQFYFDLRTFIVSIVGNLSFVAGFALVQMQIENDLSWVFGDIEMKTRIAVSGQLSGVALLACFWISYKEIPSFFENCRELEGQFIGDTEFHINSF